MKGEFAIDTNVAVYAFSKEPKTPTAFELLRNSPRISVQLLNEFVNVSLRKRNAPWPEIEESLELIATLAATLRPVGQDVHERARAVAKRYGLGFYDSLMISAALLDKCSTFFTEDMQHGLVIDGSLTITNPFLTNAA